PQPSPVRFDDRAADREAHPEPPRLRRVERLEHAGYLRLAEADAEILDSDHRPASIVTVLDGRMHDQLPPFGRDLPRGLNSIHQQVQKDLLELDPIAPDQRTVWRQGHFQSHA